MFNLFLQLLRMFEVNFILFRRFVAFLNFFIATVTSPTPSMLPLPQLTFGLLKLGGTSGVERRGRARFSPGANPIARSEIQGHASNWRTRRWRAPRAGGSDPLYLRLPTTAYILWPMKRYEEKFTTFLFINLVYIMRWQGLSLSEDKPFILFCHVEI